MGGGEGRQRESGRGVKRKGEEGERGGGGGCIREEEEKRKKEEKARITRRQSGSLGVRRTDDRK